MSELLNNKNSPGAINLGFNQLHKSFWGDDGVRALSPLVRLLFLYLITGEAAHWSGLYVISKTKMGKATGLAPKMVDDALTALATRGRAHYDEDEEIVWVVNMLLHQAGIINNPNYGRAMDKHLAELGASPLAYLCWRKYSRYWALKHEPEWRPSWDEAWAALRDGRDPTPPAQEVPKKPEQKKAHLTPTVLATLWNETAPVKLSRVIADKLSDGRNDKARAALKKEPDLAWWRRLFADLGLVKFYLGENDRGWRADFDYVLRDPYKVRERCDQERLAAGVVSGPQPTVPEWQGDDYATPQAECPDCKGSGFVRLPDAQGVAGIRPCECWK